MKTINFLYTLITITAPIGIVLILIGSIINIESLTLTGVVTFMGSLSTGFVLLGAEKNIKKNKERESDEKK